MSVNRRQLFRMLPIAGIALPLRAGKASPHEGKVEQLIRTQHRFENMGLINYANIYKELASIHQRLKFRMS